VSEAQRDPVFNRALGAADLIVPDGMPLVWLGRLRGIQKIESPCSTGRNLWRLFAGKPATNTAIFFYGGRSRSGRLVGQGLSRSDTAFRSLALIALPFDA